MTFCMFPPDSWPIGVFSDAALTSKALIRSLQKQRLCLAVTILYFEIGGCANPSKENFLLLQDVGQYHNVYGPLGYSQHLYE